MNQKNSVLKVENLCKKFNKEAGFFAPIGDLVTAVDGVDFSLGKGETYGLVGESGCGKTTTARLLVRMYPATSGRILYQGNGNKDEEIDVGALGKKDLKLYRERVKYIFQDPGRSLNPRMTVKEILLSGLRYSKKWPGEKEAGELASTLLEETGFSSGDLNRKPGDFSGGQRQRISIARALVMEPEIMICDEVVSALDVSIQGQILNLLGEIRKKRDLSMIFITHDLKIACYFCDRIGVMYHGKIQEEAPAKDLYRKCLHPYTKLLFSCAGGGALNAGFSGETPCYSGSLPHTMGIKGKNCFSTEGCAFAPRCPLAEKNCFENKPAPKLVGKDHLVRCFKV